VKHPLGVRSLAAAALLLAVLGGSAAGQQLPGRPTHDVHLRASANQPAAVAPLAVPRVDVHGTNEYWHDTSEQQQPRRQTWRYARYGAIAGGVTGLAVGGYMALYCSGTQEGGCSGAVPLLTALGIASGAAAGAILGAAVPGEGAVRGQTIASGGFAAGVARASIAGMPARGRPEAPPVERTGPAARFNIYAQLTPWFGLGPELGTAGFGDAGDVRHIAVAARFSGSGRVAPFSTINLGAYESTVPSLEYLGGGVGLGARMHPFAQRNFFLDVEGRHARNAQNIEPMRMWTVSVSGGLYW
jgi:hypothetical protein